MRELFGPKLVAYMAGVADEKRVHKWANGEGMSSQSEARLRSAYQIAWLLLDHDSAETVRNWFIGMNPQLEYEAPATAIREDRHQQAMIAAEAFVTGA
jgi:hypothetical protein